MTNNERACNYGKRVVMGRMAEFLGWDGLHRDTMPRARSHKHFNVWHFPALCRGRPGSMRVQLQPKVRLIGRGDLKRVRGARGCGLPGATTRRSRTVKVCAGLDRS